MSIVGSALSMWLLLNLLIVIALYFKPLRALSRQWAGRSTLALARARRRTF
jgi:hypothetical protein